MHVRPETIFHNFPSSLVFEICSSSRILNTLSDPVGLVQGNGVIFMVMTYLYLYFHSSAVRINCSLEVKDQWIMNELFLIS